MYAISLSGVALLRLLSAYRRLYRVILEIFNIKIPGIMNDE